MRTDPKSGLLLPASDPAEVERAYPDLKDRGVEFSQDLATISWSKVPILKDPDGNEFEVS